jgi:hypothetical protein
MENEMTIARLLRYLQRRIDEELVNGNEEELNYLSTTVTVLWEAAEHQKDTELYSVLDDMNYLLNETLMDAPSKGETVLPSIAAKLDRLEQRELAKRNDENRGMLP